jgi:hypothetical protein
MGISVKTGNNLVSNPPDIPVAHTVNDDEKSVDYNHESEILGHFSPHPKSSVYGASAPPTIVMVRQGSGGIC